MQHLLMRVCVGYVLTVLTVDGPVEVELPCKLDDDMTIVIENKGVPYPDGRGIHHVRPHYILSLGLFQSSHTRDNVPRLTF